MRTTRAAAARTCSSGRAATIVTICSVNAVLPDPGVIDYSAAKAALPSFCKSLSKELGPPGVRVNTVSPGPVETALWLGRGGVAETVGQAQALDAAEEVRQQAAAGTPTGRFTPPREVADLVLLLAVRHRRQHHRHRRRASTAAWSPPSDLLRTCGARKLGQHCDASRWS